MQPELAVEALVLGMTPAPDLDEVHAALRRAAELLGGQPMSVSGPPATFGWRLGERGVTIQVNPDGHQLRLASFGWSERDDEIYRRFKWSEESADLPYLWSLPIAGGQEWYPGSAIASDWAEFFDVFTSCFDDLPQALQIIPPEWRPSGPAVISMWNVDGPVAGGVAVEVSPDGVLIRGEGPRAFTLDIPADRLGHKQVSVPAILAGLTRTGAFDELQFWENETRMDVFPVGPRAGELDPDEAPDSPDPAATLTVQEVRELLETDGPTSSPRTEPSVQPPRPFVPTIPVEHALELATQLAQHNDDAVNVLRAWGVELDDTGKGLLQGGRVRYRHRSRGPEHPVRVALTAGHGIAELNGAWDYGNLLTAALTERFGPPVASRALSNGTGSRLWNVGSVGLILEVARHGIVLDIDNGQAQWLKTTGG